MDYPAKIKASLLLPKTDFPMRAELPKREPATLAKWREEKIYDRILAARKGQPSFVLHDGPPFANGDAHMGHALNIVLKDIVLKYRNMSGSYAPFVPGWDCHGLPIEFKVMKDLGAAETDPLKIREKCEATARHFIGVQSEQFQRLGVFGDWENPYLTLDPAYEAETLRVFAELVGKDLVYQGLRPVLWSTGCQTALAEAEIEYKEKVDPAIYVKFPLTAETANKFPELADASLLIWTTTPWTLPANLAVAVLPKLDYALYEIGGEKLLLCASLFPSVVAAAVPSGGQPSETGRPPLGTAAATVGPAYKGSDLVGLTYRHPFLSDTRARQIFAADFVTADAGTGLVHIAPGHGQDDYQLGKEHGLEILAPVDDRGCLTAECGVPELVGQYVFKANPLIIEILKGRNALFAEAPYTHDYPHCWRSKTPIVFRAVKQWFIKVETFRADALKAIDGVAFIPESGRNRIRGAVATRPDWCISRQRTWGVPLPVFYDAKGEPLLEKGIVEKFAALVEKEGSGVWFAKSADELAALLGLAAGLTKGRDTLDVWIDSGTSWAAVLKKRADADGLTFPADLYLEGSDQHRGWFQSSLLTSVATTGEAPYKAVLTNGFVVDIEGKKLSKSGTGYQKPIDLMTLVNEHGADVLRLWVASQDYQDDIPFSNDIFARVADTYRSIRNTLRILLGNLADFNIEHDWLPSEKWSLVDRAVVDSFKTQYAAMVGHYQAYNFAQVYQGVSKFCSTDLSALYIDVSKDNLYLNRQDSERRRATQTAMFLITDGLIRLLAPIMPFTAEEAWQSLTKGTPSIHERLLPDDPRDIPGLEAYYAETDLSPDDKGLWDSLLALRSRVNEKLEVARRDKVIGKSLEARVEITAGRPPLGTAAATLEELFIVSQVVIIAGDQESITVTRAEDHGMKKCIRCWKYYDHVGAHAEHPELCDRCTDVVLNFNG